MLAEAAASRFSTDRSSAASSATTRPRSKTSARWQTLATSSKSVDTMTIAAPCLERDVEQPIDFRLGADVDAGGRILEDVDLRVEVQPAPDHHLLLVAARQELDRQRRDRSAASRAARRAPSRRWLSRPGEISENALKPAATGLRNRFSRTDRFGMIDSPTRSAQTRLTPCAIASRGEATAIVAPSSRTCPPVIGQTPNSARPTLSWPAPRSPTRPTISPEWIVAVDGADRLDHDRSQGEPRRAVAIGRAAEDLRRLAPDDQQDRLVRRGLRHLPLPRDAPVAQHDHAIGDLEHFVETVRDVDHRDAARAQPAQRREQPRHLIGGQACGRLVEDKDFGLGRERAGDRHQRLFGAAQILDARVGIDVGAERLQRDRGAAARRGPIDHAEAARKAERHADVLGHRHPVDQAEVLMDEGDRQAAQARE